jgi:excisionase family DNA binding protein
MSPNEDQIEIDDEEELWSVKEMSRYLRVPQNTAYKMLLARVLPSYKLGKLRRVKKSDLVTYIAQNRVEVFTGKK